MLDLHEGTGQRALTVAGLTDRFRQIVLEGREAARVTDQHGTVLFDRPDDGTHDSPEVQRGELRRLLLDALRAGTVCWGHRPLAGRPLEWFERIDFTNRAATTARLLEEVDGWVPSCARSSPTATPTPRSDRTTRCRATCGGTRVPDVTLPGDAAHVQPPRGEGTNLALLDGAELGTALAAHPGDVEAALAAYEAALRSRSAASAADGAELDALILGEDRSAGGRRVHRCRRLTSTGEDGGNVYTVCRSTLLRRPAPAHRRAPRVAGGGRPRAPRLRGGREAAPRPG